LKIYNLRHICLEVL